MGVCQSQPLVVGDNGVIKANGNSRLGKTASLRNDFSRKLAKQGTKSFDNDAGVIASKPKLTILTSSNAEGVETTNIEAPSTGRTAVETPLSVLASPLDVSADASSEEASPKEDEKPCPEEEDEVSPEEDDEQEEDIRNASKGAGLSWLHFFQSLRHTEDLDPVIPEEVDPDAPSDEEDERLLQQQETERSNPPPIKSKRKGGVGSPPRPQDRIKMKHSRITHPNSIVNRDVPNDLCASFVPDSVNAQIISEFRKLKVQVKLAARAERKKQRIAKLEDRYEDVRGYNSLWEDFEEIRGRAETLAPPRQLKRSNSFDLKDTESWFFDFQALDDDDAASGYDFDDDQSQSSLSLHSTTSMESQRRYFEEKRQGRLMRRSNSDTNLVFMKQLIQTKRLHHDKKPMEQVSPAKFKPQHGSVSTPPSILRGGKTKDALTPAASLELGTPSNRGPVAPTVNAFQMATGQPEYHVYKRPGEKPVTEDDETPKAKSKRKQRSNADPGEVDMNNDYQVARRRRAPSYSDVDVSILSKDDSILKDERRVAESLGIYLPPTPVKRDFEYSSFAIDVVPTESPDVRIMRMTPTKNENCNRKEKVVTGNAARCLEEAFSMNAPAKSGRKERDAKDCRYKEPPMPAIGYMSTAEFLRYSDDHALVKVKRGRDHVIFNENSPSRSDDAEDDISSCEDVADDVTKQIDVLLAKYRSDNEGDVGRSDKADEGIEDEPSLKQLHPKLN